MSDWYPEAPKEQQDTVEEQERKVTASLPVIQEVLDWFDAQITTYKNPLALDGVNPSTPAEDVKSAVLLAQSLITDYKKQRSNFESAFAKYIQEQADEA